MTARGYGESEERLGRYLEGRRDAVVLSTKVGCDVAGQEDWTAGAVRGGVQRALRLLRTDVLDVVFLHSCSLDVLRRGEAVEALLACRDAGMLRVPGYSGEGEELRWAVGSGAFQVVQTSVNLVAQASTRDVLPIFDGPRYRSRREAAHRQRHLVALEPAGRRVRRDVVGTAAHHGPAARGR